eukprot:TRINITY_DN2293_c0_g1_i3.p1 TRINITY_DN2293_c0_g1~~TRINITY_DN2293_c0_g1_i3.p1  ORF type:complete len:423 (+),score=89.08 TRINITY_DN2293_c0_g1_i3:844-2112(+)
MSFTSSSQIYRHTQDSFVHRFLDVDGVDPIFSFFFTRQPNDSGSKMLLGGYDPSLAEPNATIHWMDVIEETGFWLVPMSGISVLEIGETARSGITNGTDPIPTSSDVEALPDLDFDFCKTTNNGFLTCGAIVDTGTSFIGVPQSHFEPLLSSIGKEGNCKKMSNSELWACSKCDVDVFPHVVFDFLSSENKSKQEITRLTLRPEDYLCSDCLKTDAPLEDLFNFFGITSKGCLMMFQPIPDRRTGSLEQWILGGTFIRAYVSVFDVENERVGFLATPADAQVSSQAALTLTSYRLTTYLLILFLAFGVVMCCGIFCRGGSNRTAGGEGAIIGGSRRGSHSHSRRASHALPWGENSLIYMNNRPTQQDHEFHQQQQLALQLQQEEMYRQQQQYLNQQQLQGQQYSYGSTPRSGTLVNMNDQQY